MKSIFCRIKSIHSLEYILIKSGLLTWSWSYYDHWNIIQNVWLKGHLELIICLVHKNNAAIWFEVIIHLRFPFLLLLFFCYMYKGCGVLLSFIATYCQWGFNTCKIHLIRKRCLYIYTHKFVSYSCQMISHANFIKDIFYLNCPWNFIIFMLKVLFFYCKCELS